MNQTLRTLLITLEEEWKYRPVVKLALQGGSDEHWQIFDPVESASGKMEPMPRYTIAKDGIVRAVQN